MTTKEFNEMKERMCSEIRTSGEQNYGYPSMKTTFEDGPRRGGKQLIQDCKEMLNLYKYQKIFKVMEVKAND